MYKKAIFALYLFFQTFAIGAIVHTIWFSPIFEMGMPEKALRVGGIGFISLFVSIVVYYGFKQM